MDKEVTEAAARPASLIRRIIQFPLVLMVIAIVIFIAAMMVAGMIAQQIPNPDGSPLVLADGLVVALAAVAAYWLFCRYVERAPMRDFAREGWAKELLGAFAGGVLIFASVVGVAAALGVYRIEGWGNPATFWAALALLALIPGVTEEILFRGILFRFIEKTAGSWIALGVTSALFGIAHIFNPNASFVAAFAIAVEAGLLLGAVYMLTRRLWAAIGVHAAWNFTQGWIFGLPVSGGHANGLVRGRLEGPELLSGGAFGLEAGMIAVVIATAAGVAVLVVAINRGRLVPPMWAQRKE
jgi:membrane protease YdiL (CAAX protease family)